MKARQPAPCPKCGEAQWSGPKYQILQSVYEYLEWCCVSCGYKTLALPLDADEAKA